MGVAHAQGQPEAGNAIETVTVTAQFRKQNVQSTPLAITAVNSEMLEARGEHSLSQVAATAPNVTLEPSTSGFGNSMSAFIRGVGQYDPNFALEPGVGIYIDDVYQPTIFGSQLELLDLDRVEILRGPQGTLSGRNSLGGAIKLFSKKPNENADGFVKASYGNYGHMQVEAASNFTLVPGKLFARVSGVYNKSDGYLTRLDYGCSHPGSGVPSYTNSPDCQLGTEGGKDYKGVRAQLRWLPTASLEVNLIADASDDDSEPAATKLRYTGSVLAPFKTAPHSYTNYANYLIIPDGVHFGGPGYTAGVDKPIATMHTRGLSLQIDKTFANDMSLTSITAYRTYDGEYGLDSDTSPYTISQGFYHDHYRELTQELRLNGSLFGDALEYTVGGFYFDGKGHDKQRVQVGIAGLDFLGDNSTPSSSKAVFGHMVWHATDRLDVTGGLRYTSESKDYYYGRADPATGQPFADSPLLTPSPSDFLVGQLNGTSGHYTGNHLDYRLNISYQWTADVMTYVQTASGFRGGGINPRPYYPNQELPFGQEKMESYEAGLKTEFFDHRLQLNLAGFYENYRDIALTILTGYPIIGGVPETPSAVPVNAGVAHIDGIELEGQARPLDGLEVDGSVSYLNFSYAKLTAAVQASGVVYGMVSPFTPNWKASLGVQYTAELGSGAGTLTPRIDVNFQSFYYTNAVNAQTNRTPGYTVVNGRLTYATEDDGWEVAASVHNLFDRFYYQNTYDLMSYGPAYGFADGGVAPPRTWLLSVTRKF